MSHYLYSLIYIIFDATMFALSISVHPNCLSNVFPEIFTYSIFFERETRQKLEEQLIVYIQIYQDYIL